MKQPASNRPKPRTGSDKNDARRKKKPTSKPQKLTRTSPKRPSALAHPPTSDEQVALLQLTRDSILVRTKLESANAEMQELNAHLEEEIAERKQAEQALRESQEDLNHAQAVAHTGSWRLDVQRDELQWSDETHRIFGIPKGTPLTYETFLANVYPEDRDSLDRAWQAALRGAPYDCEHRIVVAGAVKWVRERAELEFDPQGTLRGGFGTVQDITAHKQADEALRQATEEWKRTFDSVPDLIAIIDHEHHIIRANRAMAQRLSLTPEQCLGQTCFAVVHGLNCPPGFCPHLLTLADGQTHTAEVHEPRLGGHFLVSTTPLTDEHGRLIGSVHVARDITARKQAEAHIQNLNQELEQRAQDLELATEELRVTNEEFQHTNEELRAANARLQIANEELQGLSVSMTHDLRAPLISMGHITRVILEDYSAQLPPHALQLFELIHANTAEMDQLTDGLLKLVQIAQQPVEKQAVNSEQLVRKVLADLQPECEGRLVEISVGSLPPCQGDPALLKQVWSHLLSNALKFTRARDIARIEIGAWKLEDGNWKLESGDPQLGARSPISNLQPPTSNLQPPIYFVRDNGVGFATDYAATIFRAFHRFHHAEEYEGSGMGLAIVESIARHHGGRVWAESVEGQGATFYFTLGVS